MSSLKDRPVRRLKVDSAIFSELVTALIECMETGEFDYSNACIHELQLSDGRRCQVLLEIEQEDEKGNFPSEIGLSPIYACIDTEH